MKHSFIGKIIASLLCLISVQACTSTTPSTDSVEASLEWLEKTDATIEAQKALQRKDFRLLGLTMRKTVIPGIPPEKQSSYELHCGVRYLDGISDAVRSETHLKLMQKAYNFAAEYNQQIQQYCLPE